MTQFDRRGIYSKLQLPKTFRKFILADESETIDLDGAGARPQVDDFSIDDINELWSEITTNGTDPTVTFEQADVNIKVEDFVVPLRQVSEDPQQDGKRLYGIVHDNSESDPSEPESADESNPDQRIDYLIGDKLGEGGMGIIFEASQSALGRSVAIKKLKADVSSVAQRMKFLSEAVLTGSLQHPNIVPLHDLATDQSGSLFYSMKKINGVPWSDSIQEKSLDENLEIFLRICNAVAFAHSRHVIHRDIKPGNVMLGEFGEVLLMDWGLGVMMSPDRPLRANEFPGMGGTPSYMSPELARGDLSKIGPASDIYLLGATLFELVTKTPPHVGDSVSQVLLRAANNRIVETEKQGELLNIALQAMSTDPAERFESATELRSSIRNFQIRAQSMGLTRRAKRLGKRAHQTNDYSLYGNAIRTFQEAIDVWSENKKAINGLSLTRKYFAESAIENGDLDLAASILENAEAVGKSSTRDKKILTSKVDKLKEDRDKKVKQFDKHEKDLQKWSDAFNVSPDLIAISRLRDGLIFEVNDSYLQTLGYSRDEVIGKNTEQLRTWVDPESRNKFVQEVEKTGRCKALETMIRDKSGRSIPVSLSAGLLGFDGEKAIITHAHDISRRRSMELRLLESERRLRETQELAKLGTWEFDIRTEAISWSPETFQIVGISPDAGEPSLEGFLSTIHPDDASPLLHNINDAQSKGTPYSMEIRHRRKDGSYKYVLATGKPQIENGKVVLLFGSVMDISEFRS